MIIQQFEYPFDPNGTLPSNLITEENHTISASAGLSYNFIIPRKAPFFGDSLVVRHPASSRVLDVGVDYVPSYLFEQQSNTAPHLMVYGGISLLTTEFEGSVLSIEYQTLGGQYTLDQNEVLSILSNAHIDPRITSWESVSFKPGEYYPEAHLHDVTQTMGWDQVVDVLRLIADKITLENSAVLTAVQDHILDQDNPHNVTLEQLGYAVATLNQLLAGDNNNALVSAAGFKAVLDEIFGDLSNGLTLQNLGLTLATLDDVLNGNSNTHLITVNVFKESLAELAASTQYRLAEASSVLKDNDRFIPDNANGAVTYRLPDSPRPYSFVRWIASDTLFSSNTMTITTQDKSISGSMDPITVSQDGICGGFVYMPITNTWVPVMEGYTNTMPSTGWGEGGSGGTGGSGSATSYRLATAGETLLNNDKFIPDNSLSEVLYNLPTTPTAYSFVSWIASSTPFATNKMTIQSTTKPIAGSSESIDITASGFCGGFIFLPEIDQWLPVFNGSLGYEAGVGGAGGSVAVKRIVLSDEADLSVGNSYHLMSADIFTFVGLSSAAPGSVISVTTSPTANPTVKITTGNPERIVVKNTAGVVVELTEVILDRVRETLFIWTGTNLELV